jgi:hypothetical protein
MRSVLLLSALSLLPACGGGEAPAPAPAPQPEPVEAAAAEPAPVNVNRVLSPSPLDIEADLREAGILEHVQGSVPADVPSVSGMSDQDLVAFQTGVLFANALLGGRTSEKDVFVAQIKGVREGMEVIGTGKGLLATMDNAIDQVVNDTASREDFLEELDAQVGMMVPEEGFGPSDTTGPMLQAGAWLAGINVVATAVVKSGNAEKADKLLRREDVATYFLGYLGTEEGKEKAGPMGEKVRDVLAKLGEISRRDTIGLEGAEEAKQLTHSLLHGD